MGILTSFQDVFFATQAKTPANARTKMTPRMRWRIIAARLPPAGPEPQLDRAPRRSLRTGHAPRRTWDRVRRRPQTATRSRHVRHKPFDRHEDEAPPARGSRLRSSNAESECRARARAGTANHDRATRAPPGLHHDSTTRAPRRRCHPADSRGGYPDPARGSAARIVSRTRALRGHGGARC